MLVSGLTIIRIGVRLNYPFIEAIRSALSICDEYIVVAGDSDDETPDYLAALGIQFQDQIDITFVVFVNRARFHEIRVVADEFHFQH